MIYTAGRQLRIRAKGKMPTVIVVYNPSFLLSRHTEPYAIKVAMYGLETIDIAVPADPRQSPYATERRFGPKRKMGRNMNTSISGIAVLGDRELQVFHNVYAAIPLRPEIFRGLPVRQFRLAEKKPGQFQDWAEIAV